MRNPSVELYRGEATVPQSGCEAAADSIFELAVPFRSLGLVTDNAVQFCVELLRGTQTVERVPSEGAIETAVPSPDYELMMWQA
jgi:hypothetical protein